MPAKQLSHLEAPESALYLPAGHDVQLAASEEVDPSAPYVPAAHTKPEHVEAPESALYFPASQLVQEVAPEVAAENFPAKNHRTITMRESCTCCVSCTGEWERNLLHRSYKSESHHSTDQLVLLRSTPVTHTTHTRTLSMNTAGHGISAWGSGHTSIHARGTREDTRGLTHIYTQDAQQFT